MKKSKGLSKSNPKKPTKNFASMIKKTAVNKIRNIEKVLKNTEGNKRLELEKRLEEWKARL